MVRTPPRWPDQARPRCNSHQHLHSPSHLAPIAKLPSITTSCQQQSRLTFPNPMVSFPTFCSTYVTPRKLCQARISTHMRHADTLWPQTSFAALAHSAVCYLSPESAQVQFSGPLASRQRSPLVAHVYGVKNAYTALIRFYAAYNLHRSRELYVLAMWTYVGVAFLFGTEMIIYRTVRLRECMVPAVTCVLGIPWMWTQWSWYVPQ